MCDTLVKKTAQGRLFAKNSDRAMNEPNLYLFVPRQTQTTNVLSVTYRDIPQVNETYAFFMVKPSWIWGAEMGINEFGVMIGNEAIFTKNPTNHTPTLLGMDYLRLALERSTSAKMAVELITSLLETYHQGGNAGFEAPRYYDNSYLISDANEAYILETIGNQWLVRAIEDSGNISNRLSEQPTTTIQDLLFKRQADPLFTFFSGSKDRCNHVAAMLQESQTNSALDIRRILQSHKHNNLPKLYQKGSMKSVCMHQSLLGDHTTASFIIDWNPQLTVIWLSNGSTPCLSVYLPTFFGITEAPVFSTTEDALAFWLKREYVKRAYMAGWIDQFHFMKERDDLQHHIDQQTLAFLQSNPSISEQQIFQREMATLEEKWMNQYQSVVERVTTHPNQLPRFIRARTQSLLSKDFFPQLVRSS